MFSKTFLAAFFAAVVAAQSNSDNPTITPATGESVPGCKPYTLKWTPTTAGTVSIEIITGATQGTLVPVGKVATGIPNSGSFTWTPAVTLGENALTGYKIYDDATGQFQYSVPFSVDKSTCADEPVEKPTEKPVEKPTGYPVETPSGYPVETPSGYPVEPVSPATETPCTTTSTVYVQPPSTGYPVVPVVPGPGPNNTAPYPIVPPTTMVPTGTAPVVPGVPMPTGTGGVGYPPVAPTPPAQEFPGAASGFKAGLGLVGAAAAAVFLL